MRRTLREFLEHELLFEHLRTIYRHFLDTGGYERVEMVDGLVEYLESQDGGDHLASDLTDDETELLYVLRQVGGIAPRRWLFRELASRGDGPADAWKRVFWGLRRRHIVFLIGSGVAYLPDGIADALGDRIAGRPETINSDVIPGASAIRQSVHGLVIALFNRVHQSPPRVMAEEEKVWKRDLEGLGDFFHSYLFESGAGGSSVKLVRGRVSRLIELLRKMGFLEKRGKRLYLDVNNWSDWADRSEVERQSLFLSFLKDNYENIPLALEALVDWKKAGWVSLARLTEAVRYRTLRSTFHVLRVRPQSDLAAEGPGRRWVSACVHMLADLGLVYTGADADGEPVACATDGAIEAWELLHSERKRGRRTKVPEGPRAYAQPNFELLIPEECAPRLHREIGAVAEILSLDRFWTYTLTPASVARGVEEGFTRDEIVEKLEGLVEGRLPSNVREAVRGWAGTAWWVDLDGNGAVLRAEPGIVGAIRGVEGIEEVFEDRDREFLPIVERRLAENWLVEHGIRVVEEDRDPPGEFGRSTVDEYARALEAWQRRLDLGSDGPSGTFWDDVVPVEPLPESRR